MLEQTIDWMQTAGTLLEAVVLLRVVLLRLPRVYTFITLYWTVNLIFDVSAWMVGWHSPAANRISINELFVLAILFPLTVWDAFEEFRPTITKVARLYLSRLFSGILFTLLLGFMLSVGIEDQPEGAGPTEFLGMFLWLGSAMASLLFTWNVFRAARSQNLIMPGNTFVWTAFFLITLSQSILEFVVTIAGSYLGQPAFGMIQIFLLTVGLVLALWCILKLKGPQMNVTEAPEKARL